ncbi:hypothetical protein ACFQOY_08825 [Enterococcus alcedinis]|uniref:hypothetical protein n=1 Tax=Enterococcus alcedinis TaxID=1274384 RepID=UPI0036077EB6
MNKKVKVTGIGMLVLMFFSFFVIRVRQVNDNVPNGFEIRQYRESEVAELENINVTVLSHSFGEVYQYDGGNPDDQYNFVPVTIEVKVQNNSPEFQDITSISQSALHMGYNYYNTLDVKFEDDQLKGHQETIVRFTYTVESKYLEKGALKFVLSSNFLTSFDEKGYMELYKEKNLRVLFFL